MIFLIKITYCNQYEKNQVQIIKMITIEIKQNLSFSIELDFIKTNKLSTY